MSTPERAGWYDDPDDDSRLRYCDGIIWSDRTEPKQTRQPRPPAEPTTGGDPAGGPYAGASGGPAAGQPRPGTDVFGRPTPTETHGQWQGHGQRQGQHQWPGHGGHTPAAHGYAQPEPTTADGQPLASYGPRVGAYIVDGLIVAVLNLLVAGWAWWLWLADYWNFVYDAALRGDQGAIEGLTPGELTAMFDWTYFFIATGLSLLVQCVYHVGFLRARNATPGKMMLGLSVRRVDQPGRLAVGTAFMRMLLPLGVGLLSMVPLLSYLVFFVTLADLLWPLRDPRRQALHDKIAGTQVVRGRQPR